MNSLPPFLSGMLANNIFRRWQRILLRMRSRRANTERDTSVMKAILGVLLASIRQAVAAVSLLDRTRSRQNVNISTDEFLMTKSVPAC